MLRDSPDSASGHALARTDFDAAALAAALRRNVGVRHGLTLVLGCPLPPGALAQIEALRPALDGLAPGHIRWVAPAAWHLTVYGLKRSQSRPLDRAQVDALVARLGPVLRRALARTPVIRVPLRGPTMSAQGEILLSAGECLVLDGLRSAMGEVRGVDPLKAGANHITLGQLVRPSRGTESRHRADPLRGLGGALASTQDAVARERRQPRPPRRHERNRGAP